MRYDRTPGGRGHRGLVDGDGGPGTGRGAGGRAIELPIKTFWEPRLAPAGNGRFHAVVVGPARNEWTGKDAPILYLEFFEGKWSAPVELGLANVSSFWASIWEAVQIGGDGPEALVVWPTEDGIVGRWVRISDTL